MIEGEKDRGLAFFLYAEGSEGRLGAGITIMTMIKTPLHDALWTAQQPRHATASGGAFCL